MEPPSKKRRVPQELRKRSERSCDYCKKHRCKCEPLPGLDLCVACQNVGVACTYATPRKTRLSISLDELTDRYRCLEAIVKGAFPNEAANTSEDLMQLGIFKGFSMPNLTEKSTVRSGDIINTPTNSQSNSTPCQEADRESTVTVPSDETILSHYDKYESGKTTPAPTSPGLVQDPTGHSYHIGPSGSLAFFAELRNLLSLRHTTASNQFKNSPFVLDKTAQTLEVENSSDGDEEHLDASEQISPSPSALSTVSPSSKETDLRDLSDYISQLPPAPTMEGLLHAFFEQVHPDFLLFHRATFEEELEVFILLPRPRLRGAHAKPDWGWLACLHMMLVFGSLCNHNRNDPECRAAKKRSIAAAKSLLPRLVSKCSLVNIQALLLLSLYFHNHSERNTAWNLVGTAIRIALALGMHRNEISGSFRPVERETRKRVFCTLYRFEQFLCTCLGRPSGLDAPDVRITPPRNGYFDGNGAGNLFSKIELELQGILASARTPTQTPKSLLNTLKSWSDKIPAHFNVPTCVQHSDLAASNQDGPRLLSLEPATASLRPHSSGYIRSILLLHVQYHYTAVLATRPMLLRLVAMSYGATTLRQDNDPSPTQTTSGTTLEPPEACVYHACQLAALIMLLQSFQVLNGVSGLDIFYAYQSAMVLLLRLLHYNSGNSHGPTNIGVSQSYISDIITRLRSAVTATHKCATMNRFASVMESFADAVMNNQNQSSEEPTSNATQRRSAPTSGTIQQEVPQTPGQCSASMQTRSSEMQQHQHQNQVMEDGAFAQPNNTVGHESWQTFPGSAAVYGAPYFTSDFGQASTFANDLYTSTYNSLPDWADIESFLAGANFT